MKTISTGNTYRIYDDSLKTYDSLPAQVYSVRCSKMAGFFLEKHADIEISEDKIYGVHISKVEKVLSSYDAFRRNLGVILSGDKGIGKSLFAKLLSVKAIEHQLPVIIVDEYIPGIATFIESIEQESMFIFDEFDKTFSEDRGADASPQTEMLTLLDGFSHGKKLFVITCNKISGLNDYFINRPGRFHYHFRFEYPSPAEVKEYLEDKLDKKYYNAINSVISFSRKIDLNYDCLRAIAFELNKGESFSSAIKDLNIINLNSEIYDITLYYDNGVTVSRKDIRLDLFGDPNEQISCWVCNNKENEIGEITFGLKNCIYDEEKMINIIPGEDIHLSYFDEDDEDTKNFIEKVKTAAISCLTISKKRSKSIYYNV